MLSYQLLRNHAGIMLIGDYTSLDLLHKVIHDVNERSPIIRDKEGSFLGLAYDVRKALEGQRETIAPPAHHPRIGPRLGVQVLWPVLLVQSRMLRDALGFLDNSRSHQAITYALEATIEAALREDFGSTGPAIIAAWERLDGKDPELDEKLAARGGIFSSWPKAKRKQLTVDLIESFSFSYDIICQARRRSGDEGLLSPDEIDRWKDAEWPDPKW